MIGLPLPAVSAKFFDQFKIVQNLNAYFSLRCNRAIYKLNKVKLN